mmetsp:Transcript_1603/g.4753  ORF Transcript_1603/g.4753 Transcript_1603/m.4753 type:complete len:124 (-) Transcript_1603:47-418(-)
MDSMPDPTPEASEAEQALQAKFDEAVAARAAKEEEVAAANAAEAKTALAGLESERETRVRATMQSNREKEQVKMEQLAAETESENPWERIVSLVDLTAETSEGGANVARMKQVLIQKKNAPAA